MEQYTRKSYPDGEFMKKYQLIASCHFGVESVLKKEIIDLGYDITCVEDGRVTFEGDAEAVCRANIFLRTPERIMIQAGRFHAAAYEELFEGIRALEWEEFIPADGKFWVKKASSIKSRLFSPSDIQRIAKKAMVERLKDKYAMSWFEETGAGYPVRIFLFKDEAIIGIDTSGEPLHKRGYRRLSSKAPISETLAAALIMLTPWKKDRILVDPFCGSGTFPIEAAMMAANIAPGIDREFISQEWDNVIPKKIWYEAVQEAHELADTNVQTDIQGYDIDGDIIKIARGNAELAGVAQLIHFQQRDVRQLSHNKKYGFLITNPPYGERLEEKSALPDLYGALGERFRKLGDWSAYIITACEDAEKYMGQKADKNRKIYNGMIRAYYYQFMGKKPPKREKQQ